MKSFKWYLLFIIFMNSCASVKQIVNPLENPLTSWIFDKSCISVDVPPITLTSEKTAIEKQLLGENIEISKEGWLLSTPNYVPPIREESLITDPNVKRDLEYIYIYLEVVEFYMIRSYLGIDSSGNLIVLPDRFREITDLRQLKIATDLSNIMNSKRIYIYKYLEEKDKKIALNFQEWFVNRFQNYGWKYDEKKGWIK